MQKIFWLWLTLGLLLCFLSLSLPARSAGKAPDRKAESHLLEIGPAPKAAVDRKPGEEIEIVSWNIRWRNRDELRQLAQLLKKNQNQAAPRSLVCRRWIATRNVAAMKTPLSFSLNH